MTQIMGHITPSLSTFLRSLNQYPADAVIDHLVLLLRRKQVRGSRACALAAVHLFQKLITETEFSSAKKLKDHVRSVGSRLQAASPRELVLSNITRRVLGLIREAYEAPADTENDTDESIAPKPAAHQNVDLLSGLDSFEDVPRREVPMENIKEDVLEGVGLLLDELRAADGQVADSALDHIHANETVLTYGSSLTVQRFLLNAAKRRKFTVIQVEGYPNEHDATHDTIVNGLTAYDDEKDTKQRLKSLITAGVTVVTVSESAIFAVMSKVSKVFLPLHIGFPNGGFTGAAGCSMIVQAAKAHHVPVLALGAIYKLTPEHPYDVDASNELGFTKNILSQNEEFQDVIDVVNPTTEYIAPDLVDLFVTNIGGHAPNFMYRIIADHYRVEDLDLDGHEVVVNGH